MRVAASMCFFTSACLCLGRQQQAEESALEQAQSIQTIQPKDSANNVSGLDMIGDLTQMSSFAAQTLLALQQQHQAAQALNEENM